jgi:hypothetical protein
LGIDHPEMTPTRAAALLPAGASVPIPTLLSISEMLNSHPLHFTGRAIAEELHTLLDRQVRAAQLLASPAAPDSAAPQ